MVRGAQKDRHDDVMMCVSVFLRACWDFQASEPQGVPTQTELQQLSF